MNCVICNTSKSSKQMPAGLLQPLPVPQRPWSHIAIDFIPGLPISKGNVWSAFFKFLIVNISLTSGYHPESNGQMECLKQEITCFLRSYCHRNQTDWSKYLFLAEYAQNSLHKPFAGLTPFQCVLGFQPPLFPWSGEPTDLPAVNEWLRKSETTWNEAPTHLQCAVRKQKE